MLPLPHSSSLMPFSHRPGDSYDSPGVSGFVLPVPERSLSSRHSQCDRRNEYTDLSHSKVTTRRAPTFSRYWMDIYVSYTLLRLTVTRRDAHNVTL